MASPAAWEKLQYTINEGTNANTVRVLLASRYPLMLSDLSEEQETMLRGATLSASPAVMELFVCACSQGNAAWVEHLLPICGVNCENGLLRTPLLAAVENGHMDVVEFLVQHGAETSFSVLFEATDKGHAALLEFFFSRITNNALWDSILQRLLYQAVVKDHLAVVSLLTAHGADVTRSLDRRQTHGETLLRKAHGEAMARLLLREGADIFGATLLSRHVLK